MSFGSTQDHHPMFQYSVDFTGSQVVDKPVEGCTVTGRRGRQVFTARKYRLGRHVNTGWYSSEVKHVQHFELLFDTVLKRLPFLIALLARIKSLKDTRQDIESVDVLGGWEKIVEVTRLTLALANLPTSTPVSMTRWTWIHGWDVLIRKHTGQSIDLIGTVRPVHPPIPICLRRLLTERDHFMSTMKDKEWSGHDYKALVYWYCTPMILENHPEKCSG